MPKTSTNTLSILLRTTCLFAYATTVVAVAARSAHAQQRVERPLSIGVAGGLSRTSGGTGYHAVAALELQTPVSPMRLRAEGLFADWDGVGVTRVSALSGSVVLTPVPRGKVLPYALAGAGGYATSGAGLRSGWSLGLGLRLPDAGSHLFVESRLHAFRWDGRDLPQGHPAYTRADTWKYVWMPFSLGIRF
jgi:hypothetical protein